MLLKNTLLVILVLFLSHLAVAQDELNELTVDRPGIAESPFTVTPGIYQFEVGFDYFKRFNGSISNLPVALFRTGISNGAELRISFRQLLDQTDGRIFNGLSPLSIGVKVHIIHENEWIPETDILTNLIIPVGTASVQPIHLGHEILLLFQNDLYPNSAINYNIGYIWDGNRQDPIFTGSFCYNYLRSLKVGFFVEYFTLVVDKWPGEHGVDGGMTYLIKPKLQLDFSVGFSRLEKISNYFISSGFSFRLERKNSKRVLSHSRIPTTAFYSGLKSK